MAAKIWLLNDPMDDHFASAARVGTWKKISGKDIRVSPLVLEWQRGSEIVGDFLWPSFEGDIAVVERVFRELQERFGGIEARPVKVIRPKWRRRQRRSKNGSLTIWSQDFHFVDVRLLHQVDWDWDKSCIRTTEEEGQIIHEVLGGERLKVEVDPETFEVRSQRLLRVEGGGIFVKASLLEGHSFFKVSQSKWNLCTDAVRHFILEKGYTNVDFCEVGELF